MEYSRVLTSEQLSTHVNKQTLEVEFCVRSQGSHPIMFVGGYTPDYKNGIRCELQNSFQRIGT